MKVYVGPAGTTLHSGVWQHVPDRPSPPKLTKQGLRNLDGPIRNERSDRSSSTCSHDWQHFDQCWCGDDDYLWWGQRKKHIYVCNRCGNRSHR